MKNYYYLIAERGDKPHYKHETLESAVTEAKRLISTIKNIGKIEIVKSVGFVNIEQVPVTKNEIVVHVGMNDELPF